MSIVCKHEQIIADYRQIKVSGESIKKDIEVPLTIIKCLDCGIVFRVLTQSEYKPLG